MATTEESNEEQRRIAKCSHPAPIQWSEVPRVRWCSRCGSIQATQIHAGQLMIGDRFTYVGAFIDYWVYQSPKADPSFPGRVLIEATRTSGVTQVFLMIRLPADLEVTRS